VPAALGDRGNAQHRETPLLLRINLRDRDPELVLQPLADRLENPPFIFQRGAFGDVELDARDRDEHTPFVLTGLSLHASLVLRAPQRQGQ
jgi:hypothetical protein